MNMDSLTQTATLEVADLRDLSLDELGLDEQAARIAARLTRSEKPDGEGSEPVRVAAFNSFI